MTKFYDFYPERFLGLMSNFSPWGILKCFFVPEMHNFCRFWREENYEYMHIKQKVGAIIIPYGEELVLSFIKQAYKLSELKNTIYNSAFWKENYSTKAHVTHTSGDYYP